MVALHAGHPELHRLLFEQAALPAAVWGAVEALEREVVLAVAGLLRGRPDVRVADPLLAAAMVVQIVEATTHRLVLRPPAGLSRAACVDELVALIVGYLGGAGAG